MACNQDKDILGWREWVQLPSLGIDWLEAKVDTGAKTSCLHAFAIETFQRDEQEWVRFQVHPVQEDFNTRLSCEAPIADRRSVMDSGGHSEERIVIHAEIQVGEQRFSTDITLSQRDNMRFRMLLGRRALNHRHLVDPAAANCQAGPSDSEYQACLSRWQTAGA